MDPSRPDHDRPMAEWSDEELVQEFQYLKSVPAQGDATAKTPSASNIEDEMRRRGLQPDREDVIPDDPPSTEANVKPAH